MSSFDDRAKEWDKLDRRVKNAKSISEVILKNLDLKDKKIVDIGVGTGLLSQFLSNEVNQIIGVDSSSNMLDEFVSKKMYCLKTPLKIDLNNQKLSLSNIDGVVSSMTLHHIKDIKKLFINLYDILKKDGFIALADLDKEDGSFHSLNDGVYHFGFDFNKLSSLAKKIGFKDIKVLSCGYIKKPQKDYEVKILIGRK